MLLEFLCEIFIYQYVKVVIFITLMFGIYLLINNGSLIDVAWSLNHLVIGTSLYFKSQQTIKHHFAFILLFFWSFRLAGFLLYTRILPNHQDLRYTRLAQKYSEYVSEKKYFFLNYQLQALLSTITSIPLFFIFINGNMNIFTLIGFFIF